MAAVHKLPLCRLWRGEGRRRGEGRGGKGRGGKGRGGEGRERIGKRREEWGLAGVKLVQQVDCIHYEGLAPLQHQLNKVMQYGIGT